MRSNMNWELKEIKGALGRLGEQIRKEYEAEIIGEATKRIPESGKVKYPDVSWKRMAGMWERLIYVYFGLDYKLAWDAIKLKIPELKPRLEKILTELGKLNGHSNPFLLKTSYNKAQNCSKERNFKGQHEAGASLIARVA